MSIEYIRDHYNVPAKQGGNVIWQGRKGVIVGSRNAYLRIRIVDEKTTILIHPTWEVEYLK